MENGKIIKHNEKPKDVATPSDVPELVDMVPEEESRILVREELDDVLRGGMNKRFKLCEFQLSPKLLGLKDIIKDKYIGIRDVPKGIRIKPEDIV